MFINVVISKLLKENKFNIFNNVVGIESKKHDLLSISFFIHLFISLSKKT